MIAVRVRGRRSNRLIRHVMQVHTDTADATLGLLLDAIMIGVEPDAISDQGGCLAEEALPHRAVALDGNLRRRLLTVERRQETRLATGDGEFEDVRSKGQSRLRARGGGEMRD